MFAPRLLVCRDLVERATPVGVVSARPARSLSHRGRIALSQAPLPMALRSVISAGSRSERDRTPRPGTRQAGRRYTPGTSGRVHPEAARTGFAPIRGERQVLPDHRQIAIAAGALMSAPADRHAA
jgi:hypothetical protein